jgi:hypothetical protein
MNIATKALAAEHTETITNTIEVCWVLSMAGIVDM